MLADGVEREPQDPASLFGRRGAARFSLALVDQGVTSFGSLALQVALAVLLAPHEFGSFAVAAALQGVAYLIIYAVLLEPIGVVGAQQTPPDSHAYLVRALAALAVASLCAGVALGLAALVCALFHAGIATAVAGAALGLPGMVLAWFARRAAYLRSRIAFALIGSGTAAALIVVGVLMLHIEGLLSAATGLILLGLASGASALVPLHRLNIRTADVFLSVVDGSWRAILREHRPLARWGLLNALSAYASRDLYAPLLAAVGGLEIAAVHRAALVLSLPIMKLCGIVSMVVQPQVSRAALGWTPGDVQRILRWAFAGSGLLAIVAGLLLWPLVPPLVALVFRDPIYTGNVFYFYVAAMATVVFFLLDASVNVVLRALRRFDLVFWPAFVSGLVAAIFGPIGTWLAGLEGAAVALVASAAILVPATMLACGLSGIHEHRRGGRS